MKKRFIRNAETILLMALLGIIFSIPIHANQNVSGAKVTGVSTHNVGQKSTRQPSGVRATVAISPYVSRASRSSRGTKVVIGSAATVKHVATVSRARYWAKYK